MDRTAPVDHPIHPLLAGRWSPRAFADEPVDDATLLRCFEAARWSPSCYNDQPWRYIVGRKESDDAWRRIFDCLVDANKAWAGAAPALVLVCAMKQFSDNARPNRWNAYDAGQASAHFTVQAMHEGLFVHQMAGFKRKKAVETFGIPEDDAEPVCVMAVGRLGDAASLPDDLREREVAPRERRKLDATVFAGSWGATADFLD